METGRQPRAWGAAHQNLQRQWQLIPWAGARGLASAAAQGAAQPALPAAASFAGVAAGRDHAPCRHHNPCRRRRGHLGHNPCHQCALACQQQEAWDPPCLRLPAGASCRHVAGRPWVLAGHQPWGEAQDRDPCHQSCQAGSRRRGRPCRCCQGARRHTGPARGCPSLHLGRCRACRRPARRAWQGGRSRGAWAAHQPAHHPFQAPAAGGPVPVQPLRNL